MSLLGPLVVAGVALDALLGEPRRHHPLVGFGNLAAGLERRLNNAAGGSIARGAQAWMLAVVPPVVMSWKRSRASTKKTTTGSTTAERLRW